MNKLDRQEVGISFPAEKEKSHRDGLIHTLGAPEKGHEEGEFRSRLQVSPHSLQQLNLKPPSGRETESLRDLQWDFRDAQGTRVTWGPRETRPVWVLGRTQSEFYCVHANPCLGA